MVGANPRILIEASSSNPEINFIDSGEASTSLWSIYKDNGTDDLRFYRDGNRVTFQSNGNVGLGTSSPARTLHVNDVIRLEPRASAPTSPAPGDMYIDSTDSNKLKVYDGTTWQACW
jgi:hypothetical protein